MIAYNVSNNPLNNLTSRTLPPESKESHLIPIAISFIAILGGIYLLLAASEIMPPIHSVLIHPGFQELGVLVAGVGLLGLWFTAVNARQKKCQIQIWIEELETELNKINMDPSSARDDRAIKDSMSQCIINYIEIRLTVEALPNSYDFKYRQSLHHMINQAEDYLCNLLAKIYPDIDNCPDEFLFIEQQIILDLFNKWQHLVRNPDILL